jgi:hypothetical protein
MSDWAGFVLEDSTLAGTGTGIEACGARCLGLIRISVRSCQDDRFLNVVAPAEPWKLDIWRRGKSTQLQHSLWQP